MEKKDTRKSILLIDDDPGIGKFVSFALTQRNYKVYLAETGKKGLELASRFFPDLVLLDYYLPDMNGYEVGRKLKMNPRLNRTVVFMLSKKKDENTIAEGIDSFAHDYITKPFGPKVLLAKISRALDQQQHKKESIAIGNTEICPNSCCLFINNREFHLKSQNFRLLFLFMKHPGIVFSRENLMRELLGNNLSSGSRTIDNIICRLRKDIKESDLKIETVPKMGYRLVQK